VNQEELLSRITIDPQVCHGKPCIRGLRYTVVSILEYLAAGDTTMDILAEFTDLEEDDIKACLTFAILTVNTKGSLTIDVAA
jgi:uncharacterized protein (DUF433 family)